MRKDESCLIDDSRAGRIARKVGLVARKSRWRKDSIDNFGDFKLIDPCTNFPVLGFCYDATAEDVIEYCSNAK
jgi:hypothetical protein